MRVSSKRFEGPFNGWSRSFPILVPQARATEDMVLHSLRKSEDKKKTNEQEHQSKGSRGMKDPRPALLLLECDIERRRARPPSDSES